MSEKQGKATLPQPQDAYNNLFDRVHSQVFFGRLHSAGVPWENEKEAEDLLGLAGRLRHAEMTKKASDSRFAGPLNALDQVLGSTGFAKQAEAEEEGIAIKEAAAELATDPEIYNSVLALKAFEASQATGQPAEAPA